ncbi:MAG TPA: PIN domain-containing protein [Solirubrobacterales bacterium]|nr:PIN domain-containing protein [Solirubrobacterales bacterium]
MALVLDTSVLLAGLDAADPDHDRCAEAILGTRETLVVPALVLSELDYWCHQRLTATVWLGFLDDLLAGSYRVEHPSYADLRRCHDLQSTYEDLAVGVVDASILALVERLGESKLATLDHRHFATMRPEHVGALELIPV